MTVERLIGGVRYGWAYYGATSRQEAVDALKNAVAGFAQANPGLILGPLTWRRWR